MCLNVPCPKSVSYWSRHCWSNGKVNRRPANIGGCLGNLPCSTTPCGVLHVALSLPFGSDSPNTPLFSRAIQFSSYSRVKINTYTLTDQKWTWFYFYRLIIIYPVLPGFFQSTLQAGILQVMHEKPGILYRWKNLKVNLPVETLIFPYFKHFSEI